MAPCPAACSCTYSTGDSNIALSSRSCEAGEFLGKAEPEASCGFSPSPFQPEKDLPLGFSFTPLLSVWFSQYNQAQTQQQASADTG